MYLILKTIILILFGLISLVLLGCKQNVTIIIKQLPENTPNKTSLYAASNLNKWNPKSENYQFELNENGNYQLKLKAAKTPFEFKVTRGDWSSVEASQNGYQINNRICKKREKVVTIEVESWSDLVEKKSTALPNVQVLDEVFPMKNSNTTRKIWIYLPEEYESSTENYPVLYMHDAQNLFDLAIANGEEWQVDNTLSKLERRNDLKLIVIGIENGGENRINEYTPWKNEQYGGGGGAAYVDFIVKELKPFIDENYRTKSENLNTGIMGSSLGGLISMYAGMKYPEVFSKLGVFSPSFWWSNQSFEQVKARGFQKNMKIYMNVGKAEVKIMRKGTKKMEKTLKSIGFTNKNLSTNYVKGGTHSEIFWQQEFEAAVLWLFQ